LGVAVFLSITIANRRATESFQNAFTQITGRADLEVRGDLPETLFPKVLGVEGVASATPLIEALVTLPDFPGESIHLVGVDTFSAADVLTLQPTIGTGGQSDLAAWLNPIGLLAVTPEFLLKHELKVGDHIRLQGMGAPRNVMIGFKLEGEPLSGGAQGRVVAMDLAAVQEWTGRLGNITTILIKLSSPANKEMVMAKLRPLLPDTATLSPPGQRTQQVEIMLSAFKMNLSALSLVSLLVGMFFVANASAAAVIRNRVSLGILRAVGVGRRMILGMVLGEAGFIGVVGSLLGVLAAPFLADLLSAPVARTITTLYLPVEARGGWPTCSEVALGLVAGVGASVVAALIPARQASLVDPVQVLHPGTAPEIFPIPSLRLAFAGVALVGGAWLFSTAALVTGPPVLGFAAAFLVLAGFSLMVPCAVRIVTNPQGGFDKMLRLGMISRLAMEQSRRSLHRTAPNVAALAAAVSMMVGITVMIHSFRCSVIDWVGKTLTADLFIAPAANELLGLVHTLPPGAAEWWEARKSVQAVGTFREFETRTFQDQAVTLGVISGPARGAIDFLHGDDKRKTRALFSGEGIALSEGLARRLHLGPGGILVLRTPRGPLSLRVLDLYRDYTRDRGMAMIGADQFFRYWGDQGVHSLAILFEPGTPPQVMEQEQRNFVKEFGGREAFACYDNRTLRSRIVEIFNQTFAVTAVLRTISIAVAVGGVMLTLGMLVLERTRDIAVLRSMGASALQIIQMMLTEAAMIGIIASLMGLLSGSALALVLTWVINKVFFGWSIDLSYPWLDLMAVPFWMTAAALVAGVVPAWHAARITPAAALRME
jgi:putative ABC transport system permease protein